MRSKLQIDLDSTQYMGKYLPSLDGLRGLAVLAVIFYHCFPSLIVFRLGWTGVDLFFVLSGFLITGILCDTKSSQGYYSNFIFRRILRIFPLYYFVLIVVFFILPKYLPFILGHDFGYYENRQFYFWLYFQNWLYSVDGFPKNHLLIHFWSLAVEEQFYIFWPLVVKLLSLKRLLKVSILAIGISFLFRTYGFVFGFQPEFQYMSTLARIDALLIGACIAILVRFNLRILLRMVRPVFWSSIIVVVGFIAYTRRINFLSLPYVYTVIDLFCGALLVMCLSPARENVFSRSFNNPLLRQVGKYSYGLYIYHYIIYNLALNIFSERIFSLWAEIALGVLVIVISFIISILSYRWLEIPFLRLKKYFTVSEPKLIKPSPVRELL